MNDENLISTEEVAEKLGVSSRTVRRMRQAYLDGNHDASPKWIRVGELNKYRPGDVDAWLDERTVGSAKSA